MKHFFLFCLAILVSQFIAAQCLITGGDLSYVNTIEQNGGTYQDANGNATDPFELFANEGAEMVRLRLWHTPENNSSSCGNPISNSNLTDVLLSAQRATDAGMQIKLSIHYGDYFVDPGKQLMPQAWQGLSHAILLDSIYQYTFDVIKTLHSQNTPPAIVSIGNETNWGFIDAATPTNGFQWPQTAEKFNAGLNAIDAVNTSLGLDIQKAIHVTEDASLWAVDLFKNNGITNYDIIGLSYYPNFSPDTDLTELGQVITELKTTHSKEVMIFETGFAWTTGFADNYNNFVGSNGNVLNYPISAQGQKDFLLDLATTVYDNGGLGILYWEPAWITSSMCDQWGQGSSYENVSLFDFNNNNTALPAFDFFDFCTTTSIHEIHDTSLKIYPNPILDGAVKIESNLNLLNWNLFNATGQNIQNGEFASNQKSYSTSFGKNLVGIHFLQIMTTEGDTLVKKLVF